MPRPRKPVPLPDFPPTQSEAQEERQRAQKIRMMAATKTSPKAMAQLLGMPTQELRKRYAEDIKTGHDYVYAAVSLRYVAAAIGGDIRAMDRWMRQFGGWKDVSRRELTGKDGSPISFQRLDDTSLAAVIAALRAQEAAGRGGSGTPQTIDYDGATDLDPVPGAADEGTEQQG
jgi:hypothetical protein